MRDEHRQCHTMPWWWGGLRIEGEKKEKDSGSVNFLVWWVRSIWRGPNSTKINGHSIRFFSPVEWRVEAQVPLIGLEGNCFRKFRSTFVLGNSANFLRHFCSAIEKKPSCYSNQKENLKSNDTTFNILELLLHLLVRTKNKSVFLARHFAIISKQWNNCSEEMYCKHFFSLIIVLKAAYYNFNEFNTNKYIGHCFNFKVCSFSIIQVDFYLFLSFFEFSKNNTSKSYSWIFIFFIFYNISRNQEKYFQISK